MAVSMHGTGTESIVLLPGLDGTEILFEPLRRHLPAWLVPRVVVYPERGANDYEALLPHVVDALRRGPPAHLLAWSFSGPLALRAAAACPDRVVSVVLCASFVVAPAWWLPPLRPLLCGPLVAAVRTVRRLPLWLGAAVDDPLRSAKARIWRRVPAATLATRVRAIADVDARPDLRCCPVPVGYLTAEHDRVVAPHNLELVRRERPAVRVATTPGRHFALWTHAAASAAAVVALVQQARRAGATPGGSPLS